MISFTITSKQSGVNKGEAQNIALQNRFGSIDDSKRAWLSVEEMEKINAKEACNVGKKKHNDKFGTVISMSMKARKYS